MKKLFALVLTLALVFAIAAPAMAATWGPGTPSVGSPFTVTVTTYKVTYDALGNPVYTALGNAAVVQGTPVAFKVTFKVPSYSSISTYYHDMTTLTFDSGIDLTNLSNVKSIGTPPTTVSINAGLTAITDLGITAPATSDAAKEYSYSFTATVASTSKALVEGYVGYKSGTSLVGFTYDGYSFTSNTVSKGSNVLTLTKNSSNVVTGWQIADGTYTATVLAGPIFVLTVGDATYPAGTIVANTHPLFATLNTVYTAFTSLLGFDVTSTGIYFTEANILANFAKGGYAKATGTFLPYSSEIIVPPSNPTVPNTGDNMSVIGFVMVGLALLATAAVIVKKVRA
ncbi:MAG TPA: LPXTG cell wall anchor domain-containing protein [Clostridia bacterium]|nr:LPXTG cell wall anchor domain-containing protein [Clostridia bacterium]